MLDLVTHRAPSARADKRGCCPVSRRVSDQIFLTVAWAATFLSVRPRTCYQVGPAGQITCPHARLFRPPTRGPPLSVLSPTPDTRRLFREDQVSLDHSYDTGNAPWSLASEYKRSPWRHPSQPSRCTKQREREREKLVSVGRRVRMKSSWRFRFVTATRAWTSARVCSLGYHEHICVLLGHDRCVVVCRFLAGIQTLSRTGPAPWAGFVHASNPGKSH